VSTDLGTACPPFLVLKLLTLPGLCRICISLIPRTHVVTYTYFVQFFFLLNQLIEFVGPNLEKRCMRDVQISFIYEEMDQKCERE